MTGSEARGIALSRLMQAIHRRVEVGERVPCIDPHRGHLWLSEDREDREAAAIGCSTCPALEACQSYVERFPEPAGTWAGRHTLSRRREVAS
jgi:hypothetical protein